MKEEVITEVTNKELPKIENRKGKDFVYIVLVLVILSLSAVIVYLTQYEGTEITSDEDQDKVEDIAPNELTIKMNTQVEEDFIVISESMGSGMTPDGSIAHQDNSYLLGTNIGDSLTTSFQSGTYTFTVKEVNDEYILIGSSDNLFLTNDLVNYFTEFKINRVTGTEIEVNSGTLDGYVDYTFIFFSK